MDQIHLSPLVGQIQLTLGHSSNIIVNHHPRIHTPRECCSTTDPSAGRILLSSGDGSSTRGSCLRQFLFPIPLPRNGLWLILGYMGLKYSNQTIFHMNFYKSCSDLRFWENAHIVWHYWCVKFQKKTSKWDMQDYFVKLRARLYLR
jgi:hypothetical protein